MPVKSVQKHTKCLTCYVFVSARTQTQIHNTVVSLPFGENQTERTSLPDRENGIALQKCYGRKRLVQSDPAQMR